MTASSHKKQNEISVLLVGIGGYGGTYVSALLEEGAARGIRIAGVADPFADRARQIDEIRARGIPVFADLGAFYREHSADLAVLSSPIHLHGSQTCEALAHDSHVLCEKPLGATIQEAQRLIAARDRAGKVVGIGYQWSFSAPVQHLKRDILRGDFGRPRRLRTLVLWPRDEAYYRRNHWAGARRSRRGEWILDSPANNAAAHYLHNMFYVLGPALDRSAMPVRLTAELYRANAIENYDTGVCRALTAAGAEVLFYASHSIGTLRGPEFIYEFEQGTVTYGGRGAAIVARMATGEVREYGDPQAEGRRKLWDLAAAVRGEMDVICGPEAAAAQTLCVNGMQESVPEIPAWPAGKIRIEGEAGHRLTRVEGLEHALANAYDRGVTLAETGFPDTPPGKEIDLRGYAWFPGGKKPDDIPKS